MRDKKVVVIGAGYTGLVAALRLAESGNKVTILERSETVGGLASGFKIENGPLERAYHHIFKTDKDIIDMATELGIGDRLKWHDSSVSIYYEGILYPFKGALDLIKFKPLKFVNRIRAGLSVLYLQKTNKWKRFQKISAYEWMLKASGKQATKVIWEPLLKGKFDKYYDKVSMAWLWARIHIRAQSRETSGEKLGYFDGGFQVFTDALLQKLKDNNVIIETGVEITEIRSISNNKVRVNTVGKNYSFDACIATTPSHVFAKLVANDIHASESYLRKLESINYLGARLLIFSSSQDLSEYYWHNINDINLPFLVFINHTKLIDKSSYDGKNVYYLATYVPHDHELFTCSDDELKKIWFPALKKIFPNFDTKKIHEEHFYRFANAQHIVDLNYTKNKPIYKTPLPNVFLYNFSQIYPEDRGTNYAIREGIKAANNTKL